MSPIYMCIPIVAKYRSEIVHSNFYSDLLFTFHVATFQFIFKFIFECFLREGDVDMEVWSKSCPIISESPLAADSFFNSKDECIIVIRTFLMMNLVGVDGYKLA